MTILAAIGDIFRFPTYGHLVGYSGLGASVHESGQVRRTGRITKQGRRDLRHALVEAAHIAKRKHPHWKAVHQRLAKRIGSQKAKVAIARKLLIALWHTMTEGIPDRRSTDTQIACAFFAHAYRVGVRNLPDGLSATAYTRAQLDRLGIGRELDRIPWGSKRPKLPPSSLV